jgi:hypothetical protein
MGIDPFAQGRPFQDNDPDACSLELLQDLTELAQQVQVAAGNQPPHFLAVGESLG